MNGKSFKHVSIIKASDRRLLSDKGGKVMIRFSIENVFTKAQCSNPDEFDAVDRCLSYKVPGADALRRKQLRLNPKSAYWRNWTGIKSFFMQDQSCFLTGLLPRVQAYCLRQNIDSEVMDTRKAPSCNINIAPDMLKGIRLYDFQVKAVSEACKTGRGVIWLPTGAGKTEIAIAITKAINMPTIFLTHRVNLLHQTADRYKTRWPEIANDIGIIGDGEYTSGLITFATVQSLDRLAKKDIGNFADIMHRFKVLIVDEAHRVGSRQFYSAASSCKNAFYRFCLTATPFMADNSADNMFLMGVSGPVAARVTNSELIDKGILARPFFKFFKIKGPAVKGAKNWHGVYERGIVNHAKRNAFITAQTKKLSAAGHKILLIVGRRAHGALLLESLTAAGIPSKYVDGSVSYEDRKRALSWLANKSGAVIIATNIFDEGIDVKDISAVVMAAGTKAAPAFFQRTGRATRKKKDNYAIIIDFIDAQHDKLLEHSMKRYNYVKQERGFTIL